MLTDGIIDLNTLAWEKGMKNWIPLSSFKKDSATLSSKIQTPLVQSPVIPHQNPTLPRIGRLAFFVYNLVLALSWLAFVVLDTDEPGLATATFCFLFMFNIVMVTLRLQNMGKNPLWCLLLFVPLANIYVLIWCLVTPPKEESATPNFIPTVETKHFQGTNWFSDKEQKQMRITTKKEIEKQKQIEATKKEIENEKKVQIMLLKRQVAKRDAKDAQNAKQAAEIIAKLDRARSQFSVWNGSHKKITKIIKESMKNPENYQHVKTKWDLLNDDTILVKTTFKSKNIFGALIDKYVRAIVSLDEQILEINYVDDDILDKQEKWENIKTYYIIYRNVVSK